MKTHCPTCRRKLIPVARVYRSSGTLTIAADFKCVCGWRGQDFEVTQEAGSREKAVRS